MPADHTAHHRGLLSCWLRLAAVAGLAALLTTGCGSAATAPGKPARPTAGAASRAAFTPTPVAGSTPAPGAGPTPARTARPSLSPTVIAVPQPPARLHQTRAFPSARTAVFRAEMTDLWAAVVTGRPALGMPAFFPLSAYRQVKAIADPAADWHDRLVLDFRLDVQAAHDLLGRRARPARLARRDALVRVIVPSGQASWIDPGVCYNGVGYWHVAGARVVYRAGGRLRSFGIASLISWRGRWYVVHFGAVLRSAAVGIVDQPAPGAGVTGPPGGC